MYLTHRILDAIIFYYLESWTADTSDPSWTHYLTQIELFQRHMTTAAYKIAIKADQPSGLSKSNRQNPANQTVVQKIAKAFLDGLYALLDGLVLLASDESPIMTGKMLDVETPAATGSNPLEQVDLKNSVSFTILHNQVGFWKPRWFAAEYSSALQHFKSRTPVQSGHTQHALPIGKRTGDFSPCRSAGPCPHGIAWDIAV